MGLQNAFYIIAIVYMSFMFLVTVAVIVIAFVVKAKVDRARRMVRRKATALRELFEATSGFFGALRSFVRSPRVW